MNEPKSHQQHSAHEAAVQAEKHETSKTRTHDGGAHAAGEAEPKGTPNSDRHRTETLNPQK